MAFFILCFVLFFSGCTSSVSETPNTHNVNDSFSSESVQTKPIETAGLGDVCGGSENLLCAPQLECQKEKGIANEQGICVESVVFPEKTCSEVQKPVCGLKNGRFNGYLNACEAERHGAIIQNEGFCVLDETKVGDCSNTAQILGHCGTPYTLIEFDGTECVEKEIFACEVISPFSSIEECKEMCSPDF